jgi:hypothetical protein
MTPSNEDCHTTPIAKIHKRAAQMPDISAREFADFVKSFEKSIGPRALVSTSILHHADGPLHCCVYPTGYRAGGADFSVRAENFTALFERVNARWNEYSDVHRARTIRKMALAIIRITAELGECTDTALRNCGEFDPDQVTALGAQACADASEIAGKGPFTIVAIGGANAKAT